MTAVRGLRPHPSVATPVAPHRLRTLARLAAPLMALAVLAGPAAYAADSTHDGARKAAPSVTIRPESLSRGAEVKGPHMASPTSNTIIDGDKRITVPGTYVDLLGTYGSSYVVRVLRNDEWTVRRVGPGGSERLIADYAESVVMARNDTRPLLAILRETSGRTTIEVVQVGTGQNFRTRSFATRMRVLDVQGSQARLIIGSTAGTYHWDLPTNKVTVLTRRIYGVADFHSNRMSTLTDDPYDGGCTVVTSIARPQTPLWKSCGERVEKFSFSPDGQRMATIHILSDSLGPAVVSVRSIRGTLLATYQVDGNNSYFDFVRWESSKALLLDTYGSKKTATVRCTDGSCQRASALVDTPDQAS